MPRAANKGKGEREGERRVPGGGLSDEQFRREIEEANPLVLSKPGKHLIFSGIVRRSGRRGTERNGGEKRGNARLRIMAKRERENKRGDRNKRRGQGGEYKSMVERYLER